MKLTVKDLIEELENMIKCKDCNYYSREQNEWDYTSNPKITTNSNMFGKTVWIQ